MSDQPKRKKDKAFGLIVLTPALSEEERLVLLVQHKAGHWGFPKGHAEKKESPLETANRECMEETGFSPNDNFTQAPVLSQTYDTTRKGKPVRKTVMYFVVEHKKVAVFPQPREITQVEWLPLPEAVEKLSYEDTKELLRQAVRLMSK